MQQVAYNFLARFTHQVKQCVCVCVFCSVFLLFFFLITFANSRRHFQCGVKMLYRELRHDITAWIGLHGKQKIIIFHKQNNLCVLSHEWTWGNLQPFHHFTSSVVVCFVQWSSYCAAVFSTRLQDTTPQKLRHPSFLPCCTEVHVSKFWREKDKQPILRCFFFYLHRISFFFSPSQHIQVCSYTPR